MDGVPSGCDHRRDAGSSPIQLPACYRPVLTCRRVAPRKGGQWTYGCSARYGWWATTGAASRIASHAQCRLLSRLAVDARSVVRAAVLEEDLGLTPSALRTSVSRLRARDRRRPRRHVASRLRARPTRFDAVEFEAHLARARVRPGTGGQSRGRGRARALVRRRLRRRRRRAVGDHRGRPAHRAPSRRRRGPGRAPARRGRGVARARHPRATSRGPPVPRPAAQVLHLRGLVDARPANRRTTRVPGAPPPARRRDRHRAVAGTRRRSTAPSPAGRPSTGLGRGRTARRRAADARAARCPRRSARSSGGARSSPRVAPLVRAHRLVTLTGAGGCGKTRARARARGPVRGDHPGGAWWIELSQVDDATRLADQVALAAGLAPWARRRSRRRARRRDRRPRPGARRARQRRAPARAGRRARRGTRRRAAPDVHVLVTSREPLALAGEVVWQVPSLSAAGPAADRGDLEASDSARLFLERARARAAWPRRRRGRRRARRRHLRRPRRPPARPRARGGPDPHAAARTSGKWRRRRAPMARPRHALATCRATRRCMPRSRGASISSARPSGRVLTRLATFRGSFTLDAALAVGAGRRP